MVTGGVVESLSLDTGEPLSFVRGFFHDQPMAMGQKPNRTPQ